MVVLGLIVIVMDVWVVWVEFGVVGGVFFICCLWVDGVFE